MAFPAVEKMAFFPPLFFLFPPPSFFSRPGDGKLLCAGSGQWKKAKFRHGEQFSDLPAAFHILDPSGHNLPGSHPLVKEHPLARIMQLALLSTFFGWPQVFG